MQTKILFNKIILGDETDVLLMTPKQSDKFGMVGETPPGLKKLKFQRSHIKTM